FFWFFGVGRKARLNLRQFEPRARRPPHKNFSGFVGWAGKPASNTADCNEGIDIIPVFFMRGSSLVNVELFNEKLLIFNIKKVGKVGKVGKTMQTGKK
ncbi:hypothetical protein, partial [Microseira wollei]|uniref:hypothetical protein n=1 Tax=Microseira wollei TaxID=467598 RepID=UPI001CFC8AB5